MAASYPWQPVQTAVEAIRAALSEVSRRTEEAISAIGHAIEIATPIGILIDHDDYPTYVVVRYGTLIHDAVHLMEGDELFVDDAIASTTENFPVTRPMYVHICRAGSVVLQKVPIVVSPSPSPT